MVLKIKYNKKLILILIFLFVSFGKAGQITFEASGKADISGYTFNDNSSYKLYRSNGHWKVLLETLDYIHA